MKKFVFLALFVIGLAGFFLPSMGLQSQEVKQPVLVMDIDGAITPPMRAYFNNGLSEAKVRNAQMVVVHLNTPGGLLSTTRELVSDITGAELPVAVYVTPTGAQAASAGTFLMYAAHIGAMSPGTNLGAASPIQLDGMGGGTDSKPTDTPKEDAPSNAQSLRNKAMNDTAAFIRGLADLRGRNAEWGEKAVREAASLTAKEAHKENVIDYVVSDIDSLLAAVDGKEITLHGDKKVTLQTAGAKTIEFAQDMRTKFLALITDPNIALILMNIGMLGLIVEMWNPGAIIPGTIGLVCLALALFAMNVLPFNMGGLILLGLGILLMVAEVFVPSFGALGIGGTVAFVFGAAIIFDGDAMPGMEVNWAIILSVAAVMLGAVMLVVTMAVQAHRRREASGVTTMVGAEAEILKWNGKTGWVRVEGERWKAKSKNPISLKAGDTVYIQSVDRLSVHVAQEEGAA